MPTDREIIKQQEKGVYVTAADISTPHTEVANIHSRSLNWARQGSENAATNVAESPGATVKRLSKVKSITVCSQDTVTQNATNYAKIYVYKYNSTAGAKTLVGSWNTATAAQGTMTAFRNHTLTLVTAAAASVAAGSVITYHVGKFGAGGVAINDFAVTVDVEEI